jgi:ribonuclease P protein component
MSMAAPPRLALQRTARLKQGRDFQRLRREGRRLVAGCLIANWRRLPEGAPTRVGVVVSRKVGGAVHRSRARRLLRETFRLHQRDLVEPVELVLVARPAIARKKLSDVEKDFLGTLRQARLLKTAGAGAEPLNR